MEIKFTSFKVFPDNKTDWYFKVCIFSRKESMYKARKLLQKDDNANKMKKFNFEAVCSSFNSKVKGNERQFGVIMFYLKSARQSGIVSHEMAHATTRYYKHLYKNLDIWENHKANETFAYILGNMVAQYWDNWYKVVKQK